MRGGAVKYQNKTKTTKLTGLVLVFIFKIFCEKEKKNMLTCIPPALGNHAKNVSHFIWVSILPLLLLFSSVFVFFF